MITKIETLVKNIKTGNVAYNCESWKSTTTGQLKISGKSINTGKDVYWLAKNCKITEERLLS